MKSYEINPKNSLLIIIDMQEKFKPVIQGFDDIVNEVVKLVKSFNLLEIPIIVTEQSPEKLGETVEEISNVLDVFDDIKKISFDCFNENNFRAILENRYKDSHLPSKLSKHEVPHSMD